MFLQNDRAGAVLYNGVLIGLNTANSYFSPVLQINIEPLINLLGLHNEIIEIVGNTPIQFMEVLLPDKENIPSIFGA